MRYRVLIVDDEADGRETLAQLAEGWGYDVRAAADGREAHHLALDWHPDAILSDLVMPGADGLWLLRALRTELRRSAAAANGLTGRLLSALLGEAQEDPEVRTALLEGLFYPRREASAGAIRRAQASGALRPDVPPAIAVDLFFGPFFYRMFVRHEPLTAAFVTRAFQYILEGLRRPPRGR